MPSALRLFACSVSVLPLAAGFAPASAETLQEALAKAYRTNPTLTAARAQQRAIDENVPLAKAEGRPDIGVNGQYEERIYRQAGQFGVTEPKRNVSAQASGTVPIYQGGVVRNAIRSARRNVEAGQADLRGTEASVFASVVAAYLDVIRDSAIVTFNKQNVEALDVNLQASADRFEVGDLTRTDVAQSEARLAIARADLQSAEARLIATKERYIALVGNAPDALQPPPPLPNLPQTPQSAVEVALQDNPDIIAANRRRDAAHYDVNSAEGTVMPRVSGFISGGYVDYLGSEKNLGAGVPVAGSNKTASVGVQVTVPLYQGGRPGAQQRQANARESQAIEQAQFIERDVISQTRSAYASWQAAVRTIESTGKAVDASALSLEGVKAENSAGTRTILDILDAQREALNARVTYVSAQRDAYVAAFSLLAAMGHAEARDLNLEAGPLYDPQVNYKRVGGKFIDFDFDPAPVPVATPTRDVPPQDAQVITVPEQEN